MYQFTSNLPSVTIPEKTLELFVLEGQAENYDQSKPLFVDSEDDTQQYTLQTLKQQSKQLGAGLRVTFDLQVGDVVAIFAPNSIQYPVVVFGTFYAGGTLTLINSVYTSTEVASQLQNSRATVLFTTPELLYTAMEACDMAGIRSSNIIVTDLESHEGAPVRVMSDMIALGGIQALHAKLDSVLLTPDATAFLCYSSGTTGLPKGVQLTHRNIVANLLQWDQAERRLNKESSIISVLPFSHIYALSVLMMNPIRRGMTSHVLPRFHPTKFMKLIEEKQITAAFIVPPIVKALLSDIAQSYDLSSLTFLCSGAAPLPAKMARELGTRYHVSISQGYGLTETSPVLCYANFASENYTGSVGQLLPNINMRIVNEKNEAQDVGGVGELQVRGPNVMAGYVRNTEANAEAFTVDGWFRTGDLGYMSEDGYVFVVDRLKELIKYKGFQVPPAELENLLLLHPAIQDCAVIGRNCDVEVTELPAAFCVLKPTVLHGTEQLPTGWTDVDPARSGTNPIQLLDLARDIISFIGQNVANHKKLRGGIVFTDSIPRVPAGKILRRVLRDRTGVQFLK